MANHEKQQQAYNLYFNAENTSSEIADIFTRIKIKPIIQPVSTKANLYVISLPGLKAGATENHHCLIFKGWNWGIIRQDWGNVGNYKNAHVTINQ